jgi:transmembrane sensor
MSSSSQREVIDRRRLIEAAAWRTHLTEHDLHSTPLFEEWLAADERNRQAWEAVQRSWNFIGEHAMAPPVLELRRKALASTYAADNKRGRANRWLGSMRRVAIAAGILVIVSIGLGSYLLGRPQVYETTVGERRAVTLADGSRVELDWSSKLRVDYSRHARQLTLMKGQARFDVSQDLERPFTVRAGPRRIIATGTEFNVDLLGKALFVTLIEGKVTVLPNNQPSLPARFLGGNEGGASADARSFTKPVELTPGMKLSVQADGAETISSVKLQQITAWQSGQLVFDNESLASVIERVSRYTRIPIVVGDDRVGALRISGVFRAGDMEGFVTTVTHYLPIRAEHSSSEVVLSWRPPGPKASRVSPTTSALHDLNS